jgi:hypothetical protein
VAVSVAPADLAADRLRRSTTFGAGTLSPSHPLAGWPAHARAVFRAAAGAAGAQIILIWARASVDLPQALQPTSPTVCPACSAMLTPSRDRSLSPL